MNLPASRFSTKCGTNPAMGDLELLKMREADGESLDSKDPKGVNWTPLITAIYHEQTNIVFYLLSRKIDVNLQDGDGDSPLMWAIKTGDTNIVRALLEKGADVTLSNRSGVTAFGYADSSPHKASLLQWLNESKR